MKPNLKGPLIACCVLLSACSQQLTYSGSDLGSVTHILSLEGVRRITALQARALAKAKARRQGILRPEVRAR